MVVSQMTLNLKGEREQGRGQASEGEGEGQDLSTLATALEEIPETMVYPPV